MLICIACYNGVGSEKFTASELYRCPNLSYNEDVLRERSIAWAERSYAQTVLRHLHCSVRLTQVELSADKNVAVHSCHKASWIGDGHQAEPALAGLRKQWSLSTYFLNSKIILQIRPSVFKFNLKRAVIFCSGCFRACNRSKQGELVPTRNFWIRFFKSDFKNTCWASPKPDM